MNICEYICPQSVRPRNKYSNDFQPLSTLSVFYNLCWSWLVSHLENRCDIRKHLYMHASVSTLSFDHGGYRLIHHSKYGMPTHYDTITDGQNKNLLFSNWYPMKSDLLIWVSVCCRILVHAFDICHCSAYSWYWSCMRAIISEIHGTCYVFEL